MDEVANARNDAVWRDTMHYYRELDAMYDDHAGEVQNSVDLGGNVRSTERAALKKMRYEDRVSNRVLRKLEREADLLDTRYISE